MAASASVIAPSNTAAVLRGSTGVVSTANTLLPRRAAAVGFSAGLSRTPARARAARAARRCRRRRARWARRAHRAPGSGRAWRCSGPQAQPPACPRAHRGLAVERLPELQQKVITRRDRGDIDRGAGTDAPGSRVRSLGTAGGSRWCTGHVASPTRAFVDLQKTVRMVRSRRGARARLSFGAARANSRRLRICSLRAGAVRQFTITTGFVWGLRRRSPNL